MLVTIDGFERVFANVRQFIWRHAYCRSISVVGFLDSKWQSTLDQVVGIPQSCRARKQGTRVGGEWVEVEALDYGEELVGQELCSRW